MALRALIALLVVSLWVGPALAQQAPAPTKKEAAKKAEPGPDSVVARVNGIVIRRSDLDAMRANLPPQAAQEPPDQLYSKLLDQLIAVTLASDAARKAKLNDDPRVKQMMALSDDELLANAYFGTLARKEITEPKLRAAYANYIKNAPAHEEVHARHILVPTEQEAKDIIAQLKKGADFATLAKEKTTDPAGKTSGGDLGYFGENDMVPEFAKAAFALKPGQFTDQPVHTQFGWHVIKVEDRREAKPPTYEEVAPQIARQMAQQIADAKIQDLAKAAKIEVFNADGTPAKFGIGPEPQAEAGPRPPAAAQSAAAPAPPPGQPELLPLQNGTPSGPPTSSGTPTMAPATQDMGK